MKEVVCITLGRSRRDFSFTTTLLGEEIRVRRIGADGDVERVKQLIREHDGKVDAIALGGVIANFRVGKASYQHNQAYTIVNQARVTPTADGVLLKSTLERWTVAQAVSREPGRFNYRRVLVFSGIERYSLAESLSNHNVDLRFADPKVHYGLPFTLSSLSQLERYAKFAMPDLAKKPYRRIHPIGKGATHDSRLEKDCAWADVLAGDFAFIRRYAPQDLRGRTILTDDPSPAEIEDLRQRGAHTLITLTPKISEEHPFVSADVLEAMILAVTGKRELDEATVLQITADANWEPHIQRLTNDEELEKFAFVIHPLSTKFIYKDPRFKVLKYVPQRLVERAMAHLPPMYLSKMKGIKSTGTGKEIEGILLTLGATPRELMRRPTAFTYRRLIKAARMAERMGAKLMGLGAFTSVVGDAGITVAQKSDIGITSGNSLTVAATLEAAKQAVILMGGRVDQGTAVVIGATGSIGAVCSRLLAQAIGDVVLIAPRPERLIALKKQIEAETPNAKVTIATKADDYVGSADLIVTTTTALNTKIVDIERLKPGAVVCDVARPPDIKEEDAAKRPDVLVIESGEITLPGEVDFGFDIGLPAGTAYACLSETALLALDGKFDDYTLGRNIEMDRVKEMYRLFKKHGLKLAGLRTFDEYVTPEMVAEKRRLADQRRRDLGLPVTTEAETLTSEMPLEVGGSR
ncbi:serine carboxypeptidase [Herpetosiphon llansteffanensis]